MTLNHQTIHEGLVTAISEPLVGEIIEAYSEAKRNFLLGGLRLSEVEGGRFCEAVFRALEEVSQGIHTALGRPLNTDKLIRDLASLPANSQPAAVRLHIPRALRVVYDIRNARDAAHLGDGIDPNLQDASLVVGILDWVLAELIRLYGDVSADEAQRIIEDLMVRKSPAVEDFDGFLKVLDPNLGASDHCLLLLYQRGREGASYAEMVEWAQPAMKSNLRRTLRRLVLRSLVHRAGDQYMITITGVREVEDRGLIDPTS